MKKFFIAAVLTALAVPGFGQMATDYDHTFFSTEKAEKSVVLGIRAGMNISSISDLYVAGEGDLGFGSKIGFHVGMSADFAIVRSFYINSGLYFTTKGAKYSDPEPDLDETLNPMYLEIPVLASYRYNFSENLQWQLNFGPYLGIGLAGKYKNEEGWRDEGGEEYDGVEFDYFGNGPDKIGGRRFEMGLAVGTGITYDRYYFGVNYEFGLTNTMKGAPGFAPKNSNFMISLGYNFN